MSRIAFWTECFFNLRDQWFWTLGYAFTPASSLPDPTVVSKSIPVCECPVQPAQGLLHKSWPETTRQSELCWISSHFYFCCCSKWTRAHSVCWRQPAWAAPHPHPWEEHLITKVTFCMSALNLPLTREPPQIWGRQQGLGGIIAPAALCCLDDPLYPVHPPLLRNPPPLSCFLASRKQEKKPPLSSPLSVQHANTLSDKWNQTQTPTVDVQATLGVFSF